MMNRHSAVLRLIAGPCAAGLLVLAPCASLFGGGPDAGAPAAIECRGKVKPSQEWILRLRPGERLMSLRVTDGDDVKAGDALAEVMDGEGWGRLAELQIQRRTRFELGSKAARLERLEAELEAQLQLWKLVDTNSAERRVASLADKRDELNEQVELLRLQAGDLAGSNEVKRTLAAAMDVEIGGLESKLAAPVLRAPFNGRVVFCAPDAARGLPGETMLELWDTNVLVQADVLQHQLIHVAKGCRAEVSLDFSNEKPTPATVHRIESKPDLQPGETYPTFGVALLLDRTAARLRPGMRVSVRIYPAAPTKAPPRP